MRMTKDVCGVALGMALLAAACAPAPPQPRATAGRTVLLPESAGGGIRFVGSEACRACHASVYERWRATAHAGAYAGLPAGSRAAPACLRCHVTGYGDPLGYRTTGSAPDLASVGCEACHGPGGDHAGSAHPALVPTATGGECPPCEINKACRLCHTPERSPAFDLASALARVSCSRGR